MSATVPMEYTFFQTTHHLQALQSGPTPASMSFKLMRPRVSFLLFFFGGFTTTVAMVVKSTTSSMASTGSLFFLK